MLLLFLNINRTLVQSRVERGDSSSPTLSGFISRYKKPRESEQLTDCLKSRLAACLCWKPPAAPSLIIHVVTSAVSSHVSRAEREGPHQLQEKHPRFPRPASHHHPGPGRIAVKTGDTPDILCCGMMRSRRCLLNRNGWKNQITTSPPPPRRSRLRLE